MLEPLKDLPAGVIGFEAVGEVHADDYENVLIPALEAAADGGAIRLVYVLGDRFGGYSAGASWDDAKLGLKHHGKWERFALVSDHEWVNHLAGAFGWLIPGDFRRFALAERDAAVDWVAGG
ncbi:MAG: STAS/SEC14 domain-containing protein [Acidimicrobiales bacterium]